MHASAAVAEDIVASAIAAFHQRADDFSEALDALEAPLYVTDAEGVVTHFTQSCIGFAGRSPAVGKDRWCVTWKLYTEDGEFLPHDQCPMAEAIRSKRAIRGLTAVAERPDGKRVSFMPFPTPIFGLAGEFLGAVNLLIDVTEVRQIAELRNQAFKCRRLANDVDDAATIKMLKSLASEYDAKADELEAASPQRLRSA
jgi:PAS domain-containing protein